MSEFVPNFYWQKGNQWDDNPRERTETIDTSNMVEISEYKACTYCNEKKCNDYVAVISSHFENEHDFFCKHEHCKFRQKFNVGETYWVSALYGGILEIKIVSRNNHAVTFIYTDDVDKERHTQDIIIQNGVETVEAWEYKGTKCHWYASNFEF